MMMARLMKDNSEKIDDKETETSGNPPVLGALDPFQRCVHDLMEQVLLNGTRLSEMTLASEEEERSRIISAVKRRAIAVFERIVKAKISAGDIGKLPRLKGRMAYLFEMEEEQLAPTPQQMERVLVDQGIVYLFDLEGDWLAKVKLFIESKFIDRCNDLSQQKRVIQVVSQIREEDLTCLGKLGGVLIYRLNQALFKRLVVSTIVRDKNEKHNLEELKIDFDDDWSDLP